MCAEIASGPATLCELGFKKCLLTPDLLMAISDRIRYEHLFSCGLVLMLLVSYDRRLRMISEALEQHMEGGQLWVRSSRN